MSGLAFSKATREPRCGHPPGNDIITGLEAEHAADRHCHLHREHPAEEVFVTGTFDNWSRSVKLVKKDLLHESTVALPKTDEKILYKVSLICVHTCA